MYILRSSIKYNENIQVDFFFMFQEVKLKPQALRLRKDIRRKALHKIIDIYSKCNKK